MRPLPEVRIYYVRDLDSALHCKRWLSGRRSVVLAFDCETGGFDYWRDPLRLVQIGDLDEGWVIQWDDWKQLVKEIFRDWTGEWVGHNVTFDIRFLEANGVRVPRERCHDTSILGHLGNPVRSNALKDLCVSLVDKNAAFGQSLLKIGMAEQGWTWETVPFNFEPYMAYAGLDTVLTARLWERLQSVRQSCPEAYELEMRTALICSDMAVRGMRVDLEYAAARTPLLQQYCREQAAWVKQNFGCMPGSNPGVAKALLEAGVRLTEATAGGQLSVASAVLRDVDHPLAAGVLNYRTGVKMRGYFEGINSRVVGDILHPDIKALAARTGRMSISNPPLQQLPAGSPLVRDLIIPREGNLIVRCDLEQIEVRVLAHFAGEESMIRAILAGDDLHWAAARVMYGPNATPVHRKKIKNGVFAILYGAGIEKLAMQQGVPVTEAEAFMSQYKETFPGVAQFVRGTQAEVLARRLTEGRGYVLLDDGRRLLVDDGKEYTGVNYKCQGTAALIFKQGLVRMDNAGVSEFLTIPVHDEVLADVPSELADEVAHTIQECMTDLAGYVVPVAASASIVARWGDAYREKLVA